jgi:methylmalonyl-CoA mutase
MSQEERLFDSFPPITTKEWMEKINSDLKGADFNKKLVWRTREGFDVNPFYRMEDTENLPFVNTLPGVFPYVRGIKITDNNWLIRQNIDVTNYSEANRKALKILMNGIDSVGFIINDPESVNEKNFDLLLERIFLEGVELNFLSDGKAIEIVELIINYVKKSFSNPEKIRGAFEADPLSRLMVNGTLCIPPDEGFDYLASVVDSASALPHFRVVTINASNFNNAGADIVQELAFALSMGSEYMVQLMKRGIKSETVARKIRFSFGTGSNYFPEIAKLRAARLLWSVILNKFCPSCAADLKMDIHCVTSKLNKTIYDPYVNLLRTQTEAISAVLGGADSLTVEPFDLVFRKPDEFSERIARNQQLILKEEAYFDKVADPAAGSYYIENLTQLIAGKAWNLFIGIEEKGGFLEGLRSGLIQKTLSDSATKLKHDYATRKTILLGTNQYPNIQEKISEPVAVNKIFKNKSSGKDLVVDPIVLFRGSEEYDRIRFSVDKSVRRPVVFILQIGDLSKRKARAQFTSNFFGCAGYRILDNPGFDTVGEAVNAAIESEADIVVICSSDEEYPLFAPEIFTRLQGKAIIVVAGNPACSEELKSKGIDNFIHIRSNLIEILMDFNKKLGIDQIR